MTAGGRAIGATAALAVAIGGGLMACAPGPIVAVDLDPRSLTTGLIALWTFDEGTGSTLPDHTTFGNDGAILGATWITDGQFAGALHFDGAGEVKVGTFSPQATDSSWSVAGWVRPRLADTGPTYGTVISTEFLKQGGWEMNLRYPTDPILQFAYWIGPGDSDFVYYDCRCVELNLWIHLAAVVDETAQTLSFYRNGVVNGVKPATKPISMGSTTLYLARWSTEGSLTPADEDQRHFTGDLDEFAIYNRALAPSEVAALSRAPVPRP